MKTAPAIRFFSAVLLAVGLSVQAAAEPAPENGQVTKLDGTKMFGLIEVTDDYTLKISSDSGIQKIPLALLGEKDFRKYGFGKDRSKDGRFWSERKDALESEKTSSQNSGDIEIRLAELTLFQPVIAAYESLKPPKGTATEKEASETDVAKDQAKTPEKSSSMHMFSGPGSLNIPNAPFVSRPASTIIQPAASAASSAPGLGTGTSLITPR